MEKETSCINSRAILDYLKEHNVDCSGLFGDLDPEIDSLEDLEKFLRDPNNWISCSVISKLYKRAKVILHDDKAAYKIGKYASENISLGYAQRIVFKSFWSVRKTLKNAQKINDQWNRNKKVELIELKQNKAIVRLHWNSEMEVTKDICFYNQGAYTSLPLVWGGSPLTLKEKCCYFNGAPYCEYHLKWPFKNKFYETFSRFFTTKSVLMDTIKEMERDKKIIEQKTDKLKNEIKERKQVEEALQESEEKFRNLTELLPETIFEMDVNGNLVFVNRSAFEHFRYTEQDFEKGLNGFDMFIPEERQRAMENAQRILHGEKIGLTEYTALRNDGSTFSAMFHSTPIFREGKPVGLRGVVIDITKRKLAEEELQKLASVVKYSSELINLATLDGKMIFLNEAGRKMLGIASDKVEQVNIMEVIPDDLKELVQTELLPTLMDGKTWEGDLQYRNIKTGEITDVHAMTFTVKKSNTQKPLFLANVSIDITERKRAEEEKAKLEAQLQQAQKMESIGTLAGGIAHDFNNILSPIILYAEMVLEDISEDNPLRFSIEEIHRASLRAKNLVKQILTFSHQAEQEKIPLIINPIIKEALKLLRASLPSTIEIRQNIEVKDSVVLADPTQIHQILMNLCTNAAHSMRERGGVLEVSLVDVNLHPDDTDHPADLDPGQYIKLTVSDTGHGIEPAIMEKIFDPYFTTQEKGKGTGLGLSVAHGIVGTHGGHISAYSEPDKGAKFDVYLPLFDSDDIISEKVSPEKLSKGDEHILLVDDEKQIVDVVQQMLERLGYQVTVRTSSIEALEVFRASMDKFDLVITDLTMPNMTGDKLAGELMNIRPDIPIILCTGFSERMTKKRAEALNIKGFLMKPIVTSDLAKLIREVIDKR